MERGDNVIVAASSEDEEADHEGSGEGLLASIVPVRAEVLAGDEQPLYLLWLLSVQIGEVEDDAVEPPGPARLGQPSGHRPLSSSSCGSIVISWRSPPRGSSARTKE